jgi:hypothetical protein
MNDPYYVSHGPMRPTRLVAPLVCALLLLVLANVANATQLAYTVSGDSSQCPNRARFSQEVAARLGFAPWTGDGKTLSVQILVGAETEGRLQLGNSCS